MYTFNRGCPIERNEFMNSQILMKIGDLSKKLNVSSRTLRYYEELGLIKSIRDEESNFRYYPSSSEETIKQILVLRRFDISIKDIILIYQNQNKDFILEILNGKLREINLTLNNLEYTKEIIQKIIDSSLTDKLILSDKKNEVFDLEKIEKIINENHEVKEEKKIMDELKLKDNNVRIINLKPFRVAYTSAFGASPELMAWEILKTWIKKNEIKDTSSTRYFGFNNPSPSKGVSEYGYEVWRLIEKDYEENENIKFKDFEGGLYLVTTANGVYDIGETWKNLSQWAEKKGYEYGSSQWLEEHIIVDENSWNDKMQFDLYYPIKKI